MPTLRCKPGYEGPQIVLTWDLPSEAYTDVVLVRKEKRFPESVNDGLEIVATTSGTSWADINELEGGTFYYYTLFTRLSGSESYDSNSQAYTVALDTNFFKTWLYDHIPPEWHQLDRLTTIDNGQVQYLTQTQSGTYNEYFNIDEDGTLPYYTLERFLRNLGIQLDRAYSLMKLYDVTNNINTTPAGFLKSFASLVKANINSSQSLSYKRHKIRSAVENHKLKGTITGVNRLIDEELENAVDFVLDEKFDNVLYYSNLDSSYFNLSEYYKYYGKASGTGDFFIQLNNIGRILGPDRFVVYIEEGDLDNLEAEIDVVFSRLVRNLRDGSPISSSFIIDVSGAWKEESTEDDFEATISNITDQL